MGRSLNLPNTLTDEAVESWGLALGPLVIELIRGKASGVHLSLARLQR